MAAIIRVKRSLKEDPLDAVLLNCKRLKTENCCISESNDLSTVLKLTGTIKSTEEDIFKHIKKFTKSETKEQYKKHIPDIITKLRAEQLNSVKSRRLKVINSFRNQLSEESSSQDVTYTVFDIETEESETGKANIESEYVYDVYCGHPKNFENVDLNELLSVYPLSDHEIYESNTMRDANEQDSDCSENSNAENNWRNDYPDESDSMPEDNSIKEDDIVGAINRVAISGSDLSSDESFGTYGDYDDCEDGRHYARFKSRNKQESDFYDEYDQTCTP